MDKMTDGVLSHRGIHPSSHGYCWIAQYSTVQYTTLQYAHYSTVLTAAIMDGDECSNVEQGRTVHIFVTTALFSLVGVPWLEYLWNGTADTLGQYPKVVQQYLSILLTRLGSSGRYSITVVRPIPGVMTNPHSLQYHQ